MEFASWVSPEFKLYIIKDYQRLKKDESHKLSLAWNAKRELAKVNYRIHMALFGMTAKQWRAQNPDAEGNIRDYADIYQLIILVNLESMNAELIKQGISQGERLEYLNNMAIEQMNSLINNSSVQKFNSYINNDSHLPNGELKNF